MTHCMNGRGFRGIQICLVIGFLLGNGFGLSYAQGDDTIPIQIKLDTPLATVDPRFLSFAVDASQLAGGNFWSGDGTAHVAPFNFSRSKLSKLTSQLTPAFLRIGGTDADRLYYDLKGTTGGHPPKGYSLILTRDMWDQLSTFAKNLDLQIMFTINAGPGPRDGQRAWKPDNAETLIQYATAQNTPVAVWEFGNEVNSYIIFFKDFFLSAKRYALDLVQFKTAVNKDAPGARIAGPASAFWPNFGEALSPAFPILPRIFKYGSGSILDIVTWHYYPQQSSRCSLVDNKATPFRMMDPGQLDVVNKWAKYVEDVNQSASGSREVWLGETGNAQCGGAPGVSDIVAAGFWWLDELGQMARHGEKVVVRQDLSGADYGLIDDQTLVPNPDYWNSVFWKKLMGEKVLDVQSGDPELRAYAHCTPNNYPGYVPGSVTLLIMNLKDLPLRFSLGAINQSKAGLAYQFTSPDILGKSLAVNGYALSSDSKGDFVLPGPVQADTSQSIGIDSWSYEFLVLPSANASACR